MEAPSPLNPACSSNRGEGGEDPTLNVCPLDGTAFTHDLCPTCSLREKIRVLMGML